MADGRLSYPLKLFIGVVVCEGAGLIGAIFTTPAITTWYATLAKPAFTPPNWLFAPAWVTLYFLMGVAAATVWQKGLAERRHRTALAIFLVQLALNVLWSVVFFGLESPLYGLVVMAALWLAILLTIIRFFRISAPAGYIMLPYLGWVTFAAALNAAIFMLNA